MVTNLLLRQNFFSVSGVNFPARVPVFPAVSPFAAFSRNFPLRGETIPDDPTENSHLSPKSPNFAASSIVPFDFINVKIFLIL